MLYIVEQNEVEVEDYASDMGIVFEVAEEHFCFDHHSG